MSDVKVGWGSYKSYEGPYLPGKEKFVLSKSPSESEKILAVISSTEGSTYDAVNMYDSCILSSGLIQWCEARYAVSDMLGCLADLDMSYLSPLDPALQASGATFKKKFDGKWRFVFNDDRGEVSTSGKQRELFFKNSNGTRGSWDDESKEHAKLWAACVSSLWSSDEAKSVHVEYTVKRMLGFHTEDSKAILYGPNSPKSNDGVAGALRAAYYSFAANLPSVASEQLRIAASHSSYMQWSYEWAVEIIKQLTFGPKITIYPGRYDRIRPVIESLYGIDLPNFSKDLSQWHSDINMNAIPGMHPDFIDIHEVQDELISEGYDLGPAGADGVYGQKTKQAVKEFQIANGIGADGVCGPNTRKAMIDSYVKRASCF